MRTKLIVFALVTLIINAAYLIAVYNSGNEWLTDWLQYYRQHAQPATKGVYDEFHRLTDYPDKEERDCPLQTNDTGVLLAIGQSNIANFGANKFRTYYNDRVLNFFNGKCYVAASPLLGATGEGGEFITPLADKLIERGTYKSVVIIASGIGGTEIARWKRNGDLNHMLIKTVEQASIHYKITNVLWHQGESDYLNKTSAKNYIRSFHSLMDTLQEQGVNAPVFISVSTKCGQVWEKGNPTADGQRRLIDDKKIFLGADTDSMLTEYDRLSDHCHFAMSGQLKAAEAFSAAIARYHNTH